MKSTIVIGAGAAGLAAAHQLSKVGEPVIVLEGRRRLGGRILTNLGNNGEPVELGAEFIHGRPPDLCGLINEAGLSLSEVTTEERLSRGGQLARVDSLWKGYSQLLDRIRDSAIDQPFLAFLNSQQDLAGDLKQFAVHYVEGFNAADADRIGIQAVACEEEASDEMDGDRLARIVQGYSRLIDWFEEQLKSRNVPLHLGIRVKNISWEPGAVRVMDSSDRTFEGVRVIITVPLGVLQSGDITFDPPVSEKEAVIQSLEMGPVVKLHLQFRSPFWGEEDFGFIHAVDESMPTWWSHPRGHWLTGWAGGTKARHLQKITQEQLALEALEILARLFGVQRETVMQELQTVHSHDWSADSFSRGAYSYIPAGLVNSQQELAEPVQETLFFAGEATSLDSQLGTVHGAISSGNRAARQVLQSILARKTVD